MKDEERKEEQVAPEVEAAWCRLMVGYLNLRGPIEGRSISGIKGGLNYLGRWLRIIEADDVAAAFRKQVLEDSGFWNKYAKAEVELEVEEPAGTPLKELGLSTRVHNALCRSKPLLKSLGLITLDSEGYETRKRCPYVEEILRVLEREGEEFLLAPGTYFGPVALEELKTALVAKDFLPAEEVEKE